MIGTLHGPDQRFEVDYAAGIALGKLIEAGHGKAFFVDQGAQRTALSGSGFSGRVSTGASCNVDRFEIIPHCHGTHTEGIGHVLEGHPSVLDTADLSPAVSRLVTPELKSLDDTDEQYHHPVGHDQLVVSRDSLQQRLGSSLNDSLKGLLIRTGWTEQADTPYPLLTSEAVEWLAASGLRQLLVDSPSLDAEDDPELGNHHRWWGLHQATSKHAAPGRKRSITEFLNVPASIPDGYYLLHNGVAALDSDASLSQPVIYPLSPC